MLCTCSSAAVAVKSAACSSSIVNSGCNTSCVTAMQDLTGVTNSMATPQFDITRVSMEEMYEDDERQVAICDQHLQLSSC